MGDVFRSVGSDDRPTVPRRWRGDRTHQCALKTKAGCETVAHILQVLTDLDPNVSIVSVDGVGVFDFIRNSMLEGLSRSMASRFCLSSEPFMVSLPLFVWEDDTGEVHTIPQGEGEQGDPLMPLLFCLGPTPCSLRSVNPFGSWKSSFA